VIFREEDVGGRERVTTDEERVARGGWTECLYSDSVRPSVRPSSCLYGSGA